MILNLKERLFDLYPYWVNNISTIMEIISKLYTEVDKREYCPSFMCGARN